VNQPSIGQLIQQALSEAKSGNRQKARDLLSQAVKQEPQSARAWYLLSQAVGDPEQSKQCLKKVLQLDPSNAQARERLQKLEAPISQLSADSKTRKSTISTVVKVVMGLASAAMLCFCAFAVVVAIPGFFASPAQVAKNSLPLVNNNQLAPSEAVPTNAIAPSPTILPSPVLSDTPVPSATPSLQPSLTPVTVVPASVSGSGQQLPRCVPQNTTTETATVTHVVDGDTIDVSIKGQEFTVRYIGVDTPKTKHPDKPVEYYGPEASAMNELLVASKAVVLVKDVSETDQYGRLLRYVFVDSLGGAFVNYELVRQGFAHAVTYPPDIACEEYFLEAETRAREASLGLWTGGGGVVAEQTAIPSLTPISVRGSSGVGKVTIVTVFYNGSGEKEPNEYVEIRNDSEQPLDLSGWRLQDKANHVFTFPGFTMQPGQVCRVYTDESHPDTCGFSFNFSKSAIWNNGGDCTTLLDDSGNVVQEYCYP